MKTHKLTSLFLITIFAVPIVVSTHSQTFINNENFNINTQKTINNKKNSVLNNTDVWQNTIEESSNNTNVKLFFSNTATAVFQEFLVTINYMLQANQNRTGTDEITWFLDAQIYDPKKYNFDYYLTNYGSKVDGQPSNYNFAIWTRIKSEGGGFSNQTTGNKDDDYIFGPTSYQIENILRTYTKKYGENVKFDIWVSDIVLEWMWRQGISSNETSKFYELFKHINKINVVTDGNWQTLNLARLMIERLNQPNYKQLTDLEIENQFKLFQSDKNNTHYDLFKSHTLFDYIQYEKMFTIFHTKSYTNSPYYKYPEGMKMYFAHTIDYDYVSMANKFFSNNKKQYNQFILDFETFFNMQNNKSISDFVWKNIEKYDPKKKNIIWMGDSLISEDRFKYKEKEEEINKIVKVYSKKFPQSEYNYFIKHHPSLTREYQQTLTKYMFKDYIEPIYMDVFPWELFLSWDHKMQNDIEAINGGYKPFFSITSNNDENPQTKLVGIQYTTTTIQTTAFYLSTTYGMNIDDINKSVGVGDWPIPMTFDIVEKTTKPPVNFNEQLKINISKIKKIYDPFVQLNAFPNLDNNIISTNDYVKKYDGGNGQVTSITSTHIIIIVVAILIFIITTTTTVIVIKKYRKNHI